MALGNRHYLDRNIDLIFKWITYMLGKPLNSEFLRLLELSQ
jgi:hypothetical protein